MINHYSYPGCTTLDGCDATDAGGRQEHGRSTDAADGGGGVSRRAPPAGMTQFGPEAETEAPLVPDLSDQPETEPERVDPNPLELALMEDAE